MPHSSGGGSHGGGHHGGSHYSGGHHSSSGGRAYPSISRRPFVGAHRFVYYRGGRPRYFYSSSPVPPKPNFTSYLILLFYIPFIFAIIGIAKGAVHIPKKIDHSCDKSGVVIEDTIDVLGDTDELEVQFEEFYEKTGISPCIVTISNDVWHESYRPGTMPIVPDFDPNDKNSIFASLYVFNAEYAQYVRYSSLEQYAYDAYVNTFDNDEYHWLIIYSVDSGNSSLWFWEGMQGDYTDPVLTEAKTNEFDAQFQRLLMNKGDKSVADCMAEAFDSLNDNIMKANIHTQSLLMALFVTGFIILHAFGMVGGAIRNNLFYSKGILCDDAKEGVCPHCGKQYVTGQSAICPHCGSIVIDSSKKDSQHDCHDHEMKEAVNSTSPTGAATPVNETPKTKPIWETSSDDDWKREYEEEKKYQGYTSKYDEEEEEGGVFSKIFGKKKNSPYDDE